MSVKERPILFSDAMVRAILDGRKTQTRRPIRNGGAVPCDFDASEWLWEFEQPSGRRYWTKCKHGSPGDRLWVREACWMWGRWTQNGLTKTGRQKWRFVPMPRSFVGQQVAFSKPAVIAKRQVSALGAEPGYAPTENDGAPGWVYRHAWYMPRSASRILLEITGVRIERVQDISEADAKAEGCKSADYATGREVLEPIDGSYRLHFRDLWNSINAAIGFGWNANPWVWVLEFRRIGNV